MSLRLECIVIKKVQEPWEESINLRKERNCQIFFELDSCYFNFTAHKSHGATRHYCVESIDVYTLIHQSHLTHQSKYGARKENQKPLRTFSKRKLTLITTNFRLHYNFVS